MKEAIGNALLFNIVIVFVIILIAFFVGSLGYSKAYKVKNKIIEEIEREGEHSQHPENAYANAVPAIEDWLAGKAENKNGTINAKGIGYRKNTNGGANTRSFCKGLDEPGVNLVTQSNDYEYCVYRLEDCNDGKCYYYYRVTTFMYFEIPVIAELAGDLLKIPVTGETMTFRKIEN